MIQYRRRPKSDVWHWMPRCRWYPAKGSPMVFAVKRGVLVQNTPHRPTSGELCNECQAKEAKAQ